MSEKIVIELDREHNLSEFEGSRVELVESMAMLQERES